MKDGGPSKRAPATSNPMIPGIKFTVTVHSQLGTVKIRFMSKMNNILSNWGWQNLFSERGVHKNGRFLSDSPIWTRTNIMRLNFLLASVASSRLLSVIGFKKELCSGPKGLENKIKTKLSRGRGEGEICADCKFPYDRVSDCVVEYLSFMGRARNIGKKEREIKLNKNR